MCYEFSQRNRFCGTDGTTVFVSCQGSKNIPRIFSADLVSGVRATTRTQGVPVLEQLLYPVRCSFDCGDADGVALGHVYGPRARPEGAQACRP